MAKLRILVTNDDGINAPGLKILEKIAHSLSVLLEAIARMTEIRTHGTLGR